METIKGYKAYKPGLICIGKKYEVGKTYEENGHNMCTEGMMHFCKKPEDVFSYYSPVNRHCGALCEFTDVEADAERTMTNEDAALQGSFHTNDSKCATNVLKIGSKIPFRKFIEKCIKSIKSGTESHDTATAYLRYNKMYEGYGRKIHICNNDCVIDAYGAMISSDKPNSFKVVDGSSNTILDSGKNTGTITTGFNSTVVATGAGSAIVSTGENSMAVTNGMGGMSFCTNQHGFSYVDAPYSEAMCFGPLSSAVSTKHGSFSAALGRESIAKAALGSWLILTEWESSLVNGHTECWHVKDIKAVQVDGKLIKPNIFYRLRDGEIVEV